ncbi:MAG: hypothetical protein IH800_16760, partial [Myxococcales bacterium]|nr:hypothetical protein [Myxococcales bacterium]
GLYSQCYEMGFDLARKAERALQHELGDPQLNFIGNSHLAGKEGLLAGEDLPGKNLRFDRDSNRLVGRANSVGIGDRMTVMLARAERLTQRLDFSFARWGWEEDTVARAR